MSTEPNRGSRTSNLEPRTENREHEPRTTNLEPRTAGSLFVVLVQLTVRPEFLEEFERALLHNARESLAHDVGCLRFDVSQQADDPCRWVMHEVYTHPDAHAEHRKAAHFLAFNDVVTRAVVDRTATRCVGRLIAP